MWFDRVLDYSQFPFGVSERAWVETGRMKGGRRRRI